MKTITHRDGLLHVETPLGIVNIRVGLHDAKGRRVDSIEVLAPACSGDKKVRLSGYSNTRLIEALHARN